MKNGGKAATILLAATLTLAPLSASAAQHSQAKSKPKPAKVEYVALGDSLAAGQTPYGVVDYGYADYIADSFVKGKYRLADFDNFGVPGYTSDKLKNDVVNSAKIRKEIKEATHITIDIGANDLLGKLKTDPSHVTDAIKEVAANLQATLSEIDQLNPKVKVYVMGYYNPYPYYPKEQQEQLKPLLKGLNDQIKALSKKNGDTYISTEKVIEKKYKQYIPNQYDIHLSKSGYKAIAKEFWKGITKKK